MYALTGLATDIADGPAASTCNQLDLAVELFTDAADFGDDDTVSEALGFRPRSVWFVDYAINPDPKRLAPSGPFDNESEAWRLSARLLRPAGSSRRTGVSAEEDGVSGFDDLVDDPDTFVEMQERRLHRVDGEPLGIGQRVWPEPSNSLLMLVSLISRLSVLTVTRKRSAQGY